MRRLLPTATLLLATLAAFPACAWDRPPPAYGWGPAPGWHHRPPPPPPRWGWHRPPPRAWAAPPPRRYSGWDRPRYDRPYRGWNDGRHW